MGVSGLQRGPLGFRDLLNEGFFVLVLEELGHCVVVGPSKGLNFSLQFSGPEEERKKI